MLPIPTIIVTFFFIELVCSSIFLLFIVFLATRKHLRTPFFKLFNSTGLAGIGVVTTFWMIHLINFVPVHRDSAALIYVGQTINGSAAFCYTTGKFLITLNRVAVLANAKSTLSSWSPRKTNILIACQYIVPLIPHCYFAVAPINWIADETAVVQYTGWDDLTGSIYRSITGAYYALYAVVGIGMNVVAYKRLKALSLSSTLLYKQQRSLGIYSITSTSTHLLFAMHQFAWSFAFLEGDREMLATVRTIRPFVQDLTTFIDPIVLLVLSKQVRNEFCRKLLRKVLVLNSSHQMNTTV